MQPGWQPTIRSVVDNGDGTSVVVIDMIREGQARVTVRNDMLNTPDVLHIYYGAAAMATSAYTTVRQSRRDQLRKGD